MWDGGGGGSRLRTKEHPPQPCSQAMKSGSHVCSSLCLTLKFCPQSQHIRAFYFISLLDYRLAGQKSLHYPSSWCCSLIPEWAEVAVSCLVELALASISRRTFRVWWLIVLFKGPSHFWHGDPTLSLIPLTASSCLIPHPVSEALDVSL